MQHRFGFIWARHVYPVYSAHPSIDRLYTGTHWRRLVKNIGWENQNIGGQKVVRSDKCMGVSQLLGADARAFPQSLRLCRDLAETISGVLDFGVSIHF